MDIRVARADDVPAIVAFVTEVLTEFGLTFGNGATTDDQLRGLPGSYADHGGAFWVATDPATGGLLGTAGVFPVEPATYELRKMYVARAVRGRGVGVQFLEHAVAFARERGGRHMVLDTVEAMTRAIAFYEAHGFVRDDSQIRGARCSRGYTRAL